MAVLARLTQLLQAFQRPVQVGILFLVALPLLAVVEVGQTLALLRQALVAVAAVALAGINTIVQPVQQAIRLQHPQVKEVLAVEVQRTILPAHLLHLAAGAAPLLLAVLVEILVHLHTLLAQALAALAALERHQALAVHR